MAFLRISVLFLGILLAGISGCGKIGPLYLPADTVAEPEPATEAPQADAPASPAISTDNSN